MLLARDLRRGVPEHDGPEDVAFASGQCRKQVSVLDALPESGG